MKILMALVVLTGAFLLQVSYAQDSCVPIQQMKNNMNWQRISCQNADYNKCYLSEYNPNPAWNFVLLIREPKGSNITKQEIMNNITSVTHINRNPNTCLYHTIFTKPYGKKVVMLEGQE